MTLTEHVLQLPAQHPPATVLSASHSRGEANFIESFQQPHLSKGQRMRLQQWTLQVSTPGPDAFFQAHLQRQVRLVPQHLQTIRASASCRLFRQEHIACLHSC